MSEALDGAKICYSELEKMVYVVIMASRKLKHYFTDHPITIPTTYPLRDILANREVIGRISKWAVELAHFNLTFTSQRAIKSQALADFIADWTPSATAALPAPTPSWTSFVNGAWGSAGAAVAASSLPTGGILRHLS